jgi:hypothetical protein
VRPETDAAGAVHVTRALHARRVRDTSGGMTQTNLCKLCQRDLPAPVAPAATPELATDHLAGGR